MSNKFLHKVYVKFLRERIKGEINRQRVKLLFDVWGYRRLFEKSPLSFGQRLILLRRFLKVDWNMVHAHKPSEIAAICVEVARRQPASGQIFIEAGCFQGGSSAKFSILCKMLDCRLHIYDSFEGVEKVGPEGGGFDFSGHYAVPMDVVKSNISRYGEIDCCDLHKGWFKDTMRHISQPVKIAYIDCDLAIATKQALEGILPVLVDGGAVFSQDYHIRVVKNMLNDPTTWKELSVPQPQVSFVAHHTAMMLWDHCARDFARRFKVSSVGSIAKRPRAM